MNDLGRVMYPEMDQIEQEEKERKQATTEGQTSEKTAAQVLYPDVKADDPSMEFSEEDQDTLSQMDGLLNAGDYGSLGNMVEGQLRGLGLSDDDLEPELSLLRYAQAYATESPEWRKWIRGALNNLFHYKTKKARGE